MSMIKRQIDELYEKAGLGDDEARKTLAEAGLLIPDADAAREDDYHWSDPYADETGENFDVF